jgi:hypothetical protein
MSKMAAAVARVRVVVEVPASSWGSDCSVQQVFDQASREASARIAKLIQEHLPGARVIGEPEVTAVMARRE